MITHPTEAEQLRAQRVLDLTRHGHSATEIAAIERISQRSVYRIRQRYGASQPNRAIPMSDDEIRTATELFADGASRAEVARTLGRSDTTLAHRFPGQCWSYVQVGQFAALRFRFGAMA